MITRKEAVSVYARGHGRSRRSQIQAGKIAISCWLNRDCQVLLKELFVILHEDIIYADLDHSLCRTIHTGMYVILNRMQARPWWS